MPKSKLVLTTPTLAELLAQATPAELKALGINPAAQAAALQDEQNAKKQKRVTTRKVKKVFDAGMAHPPTGFRWVYNRLDREFELMFDGMVYAFDSHEYRLVTLDVARFLWNRSLIQYDPTGTRGLRALALDPLSPDQMEDVESEGFGEPLADPKNAELLDRSRDANPMGRSTGGLKTKPAMLPIGEAGGSNLPLTTGSAPPSETT